MGLGFSAGDTKREREMHGGCRVVGKVCMHACMGDTWVLALALGGGSKRASEEGREG